MKSELEKALCGVFGRRHCVLTNRGTTALTAAFQSLGRPVGSQALFPAVLCSVPVFSAGFAGWDPLFADVNPADGNFDLQDVERRLREGQGRVGAVVPVHMFGKPDDLESLRRLCFEYDAALVEDLALSMGARFQGRRAGGFGEAACLSFVRKMLPIEMGGALLTDDADLAARAQFFVDSLPPASAPRDEVAAAMKAFHALTGFVAAGGWKRGRLLKPFANEFRRLFLSSTTEADWTDDLPLKELSRLDEVVQARRARAEIYDTFLTHPRILPFPQPEGSAPFAFAFRLEGLSAEAFLQFAEGEGLRFPRVSYPAIPRIFGIEGPFPQAELLEKEGMAFPLDDRQPLAAIQANAEEFRATLEKFLARSAAPPSYDWRGKLELRMG